MAFKKSKSNKNQPKRFKVLLFGTHGVGKTWASLQMPNPAVIDMEQGSVHYQDEFDFIVENTSDPDEVLDTVHKISESPVIPLEDKSKYSIKTVVLDPIHIWELSLEQKVIAKRRKEERDADYILQPQDYKLIRIEKKKLMLKLMNIDLNVVVCARTKDLYAPGEFMKRIGIGPDCDNQWLGYFDTILFVYIDKTSKKRMARVYDKDRTNKFPKDKAGNHVPFEWSYANFAKHLKGMNFEADSDVNATHEMQNSSSGRHFETVFAKKKVRTSGVNGETLETIAEFMKEYKDIVQKLLTSAEVNSPYDLTQDMANYLVSQITEEIKKHNESK